MRNGKWVETTKPEYVEESITCDVCGVTYTDDDDFELQEFVHIVHECGYGSIFGDGNTITLDICQYCLKNKLEKSIVTVKPARLSDKMRDILERVKRVKLK